MNKKPKYDPNKHHRKSIRLKGYDYSQAGLYFITICCQNRQHLFGEIQHGKMILNDAGEIANNCWLDIPQHFPNAILHQHIIMPNHIHGIIEIVGANHHSPDSNHHSPNENKKGANNYLPLRRSPSKTIGSMVRGFKIGVTKWIRKNTNIYDVWQRNYYEHIIRNEKSYNDIAEYIINNPINWEKDKFFNI